MLRLAETFWVSATRVHNSSNVTSGCFWTADRMTSSHSASVRWGPCWRGHAEYCPVSRHWRHHFSTVDRLTPNVSATSAWLFLPVFNAATTRSRKSWE
jgi:hypothetical protein